MLIAQTDGNEELDIFSVSTAAKEFFRFALPEQMAELMISTV